MIVLQKVLTLWKEKGHRVLLFTQTPCMLDILESFMAQCGHSCTRLEGTTSVAERQALLDAFNAPTSNLFVFLLTKRAGGIGVNPVSADHVVNPSTDVQARERAWRTDQQKPVTVYRLVTTGTIEEKIYHRQIFKTIKRKRCFNKHSLRDLFVLDESNDDESVAETNAMFLAGNVTRPTKVDGKEQEHARVDPAVPGDNDVVLQRFFRAGDERSVFDHSAVEANGVKNQEADLVEIEATTISQGALSALPASGALVRQQRETIFTLTWTGRSGTAGHRLNDTRNHNVIIVLVSYKVGVREVEEEEVRRRLVTRDACALSTETRRGGATDENSTAGRHVEHVPVSRLRKFRDIVAPKDKLVFRHVLREMALCRSHRWTLKPSYSLAS
ncbi:hypothetical protein PsorP6_002803 [Peronosclerospora sorghi]|uniref:Uncharacterized protein n=1 Tax=Peronosclerospora sorghi TaxID=230839 RepID=A0ACC0VPZ0_9STRA|nr:hypothetical protein PsorP6_002803 [Peronosclerospora sorghi]